MLKRVSNYTFKNIDFKTPMKTTYVSDGIEDEAYRIINSIELICEKKFTNSEYVLKNIIDGLQIGNIKFDVIFFDDVGNSYKFEIINDY